MRENGILLAESRMRENRTVLQRLLAMEKDSDARVRFQLLCTLGFVSTPAAQSARDRLLTSSLGDRWMQIAALSASPDEANRLFAIAVHRSAPASFFGQVATVIGARRRPTEMQSILRLLTAGSGAEWRAATLDGLARGMRGKESSLPDNIKGEILRLFVQPDATVRRAALHLLEVVGLGKGKETLAAIQRAENTANNPKADAELRADSIGLLALTDVKERRTFLEHLIKPTEPEAVQIAAVRALGRIPGEETARFLLKYWRGMTANVRMEAADALYRDPVRIPVILAALQNGEIQPWTLAFRHRRQLVMHQNPEIRETARKLFENAHGDRSKIIAEYQPALTKPANAENGRAVFKSICAKCHKLDGVGADVGPDLATVRHQPKQVLLTAILDPSQSLSQGFEAYVVETFSGATLDGVLGPQTSTAITLKHEEGKQDVVQRKDIRNMYTANLSAMPADLEKQIGLQQMADLLEFVKTSH